MRATVKFAAEVRGLVLHTIMRQGVVETQGIRMGGDGVVAGG